MIMGCKSRVDYFNVWHWKRQNKPVSHNFSRFSKDPKIKWVTKFYNQVWSKRNKFFFFSGYFFVSKKWPEELRNDSSHGSRGGIFRALHCGSLYMTWQLYDKKYCQRSLGGVRSSSLYASVITPPELRQAAYASNVRFGGNTESFISASGPFLFSARAALPAWRCRSRPAADQLRSRETSFLAGMENSVLAGKLDTHPSLLLPLQLPQRGITKGMWVSCSCWWNGGSEGKRKNIKIAKPKKGHRKSEIKLFGVTHFQRGWWWGNFSSIKIHGILQISSNDVG